MSSLSPEAAKDWVNDMDPVDPVAIEAVLKKLKAITSDPAMPAERIALAEKCVPILIEAITAESIAVWIEKGEPTHQTLFSVAMSIHARLDECDTTKGHYRPETEAALETINRSPLFSATGKRQSRAMPQQPAQQATPVSEVVFDPSPLVPLDTPPAERISQSEKMKRFEALKNTLGVPA